jgi:hypothetical protein
LDAVVRHLAEEMDYTSALLNLSAADLQYGENSDLVGDYGQAQPIVEERDDFYGSLAKEAPQVVEATRPDWLRGEMSRADAEMLLQSDPTPGNFLIRESKARPGTYAISLVGLGLHACSDADLMCMCLGQVIPDGRIEHHNLVPKNGTFMLDG